MMGFLNSLSVSGVDVVVIGGSSFRITRRQFEKLSAVGLLKGLQPASASSECNPQRGIDVTEMLGLLVQDQIMRTHSISNLNRVTAEDHGQKADLP